MRGIARDVLPHLVAFGEGIRHEPDASTTAKQPSTCPPLLEMLRLDDATLCVSALRGRRYLLDHVTDVALRQFPRPALHISVQVPAQARVGVFQYVKRE